MTQEQKAKAYDEALEKARIAYNKITPENTAVKKLLEESFPELAESEDERIRKEIISALKFANDGGVYDKHIAYLEKQKEQKPVEYLDRDKVYAIMKKLVKLAAFSQLIPINSDEYKKIDEITCDVRSLLDYPIEQKPVEWSEEDENVIETLIRELRLNAQFELAVKKLGLDYIQTLTVLDKCRRLHPRPSWKPSKQEIDAFETALKGKFQNGVYPAVRLCELFQKLKKLYYNDKISQSKGEEEPEYYQHFDPDC